MPLSSRGTATSRSSIPLPYSCFRCHFELRRDCQFDVDEHLPGVTCGCKGDEPVPNGVYRYGRCDCYDYAPPEGEFEYEDDYFEPLPSYFQHGPEHDYNFPDWPLDPEPGFHELKEHRIAWDDDSSDPCTHCYPYRDWTSPSYYLDSRNLLRQMDHQYYHWFASWNPSPFETSDPFFVPSISGDESYSKERFVRGEVEGRAVEALADSGADGSFISAAFAYKMGLRLCKDSKRVVLGNKQSVVSPGLVNLRWRFSDETDPYTVTFRVLPRCSKRIILGGSFLEESAVLTDMSHRVRIRPRLTSRPEICLLGNQRKELRGRLAGKSVGALLDSGSDLNIVSEKAALRFGLRVNRDPQYCVEVGFGDGSTAWTTGVVQDASWTVDNVSYHGDFYVLRDVASDVILGSNYVFDYKAFVQFADFIEDAISGSDSSVLCNIRWIGRYGEAFDALERQAIDDAESPDAFSPRSTMRELTRREEIDRLIDALPLHEQEEVRRNEQQRRDEWEARNRAHDERLRQSSSSSPSQSNPGPSKSLLPQRPGIKKKLRQLLQPQPTEHSGASTSLR